jgi:hypothetical protein
VEEEGDPEQRDAYRVEQHEGHHEEEPPGRVVLAGLAIVLLEEIDLGEEKGERRHKAKKGKVVLCRGGRTQKTGD